LALLGLLFNKTLAVNNNVGGHPVQKCSEAVSAPLPRRKRRKNASDVAEGPKRGAPRKQNVRHSLAFLVGAIILRFLPHVIFTPEALSRSMIEIQE